MPGKFIRNGGKSQYWLASVLLVLLPLLAVLQYSWLGQLSDSEQKQMLVGARAAATRFGEDFDREITTVFAAFLPDLSSSTTATSERVVQAYTNWQMTSRYPQLIQSIYQVALSTEQEVTLARFNPASNRMETIAWPDEMTALRNKMKERITLLGGVIRLSGALPKIQRQSMMLEAELPALLIPQPEMMKFVTSKQFPLSFLIVVLQKEYLVQEFLPSLTQRHFGEDGQNTVELTITNHTTGQLFYHSTAQPLTAAQADVSSRFFRLQPAELREHIRQRWQFSKSPLALVLTGGDAKTTPELLMPPMMLLMGAQLSSEQTDGLWELHLRHQSGSLAAAVAKARRRNLALSFGILLVLAVSVVLLVDSARRARQLAQQQMDFVAGVSHELRMPITVIDSAAHNLASGVTRSPEQMQRYGQIIKRQTRQLHGMIEQVLEFAGNQSGQKPYALQPVQLNLLLEEFVQANQTWLAELGFQLQLNLAPDLPVVQADAAALRRALQNLLNNAQKYSGESRWIGLQAEVEDHSQSKQVALSLSDRGRGIAAQDLPHIFEPFYRSSDVKAAQLHGNGLGLSLVRNIVQAHRGTITVQSKIGTGSTFTIRLPLAELKMPEQNANEQREVLHEAQG